ncbi:hypothetical protein [Hymenobacter sp.]|uniref:hypothetical protein n=1 Tax=Hymenobacter sp. TaxID=1898978 RepID=UPI00286AE227|nr:hypothetical protein [Hymenobacter sp.]
MNYIQHTRAAHEWLLAQPASRPLHISLYMALFHQWNAERFPEFIELDHDATMKAARIGSRHTYRDTLRDLNAWGLLTYQPSKSKHTDSCCYMAVLSGPEVAQVKPPTEARSGPDKTPPPGPEVAQALRPEVAPVEASSRPEVAQDTVLSKTVVLNSVVVNGDAATAKKKKGPAALPDEGLLEAEVFNPDLLANDPGAAPKEKVAPKRKGVWAEAIRAAATAGPNEPRRRGPLPELLFSQSAIAAPDAFAAAFEGTDYALADLRHYHQLVATWRDKKTGLPPLRKDWIATASRFMLNDAADNRLKLAPHVHRVSADGTGQSNAGIPSTGYRSSRYD